MNQLSMQDKASCGIFDVWLVLPAGCNIDVSRQDSRHDAFEHLVHISQSTVDKQFE
jgi:hypothetical protein